MDGLVYLSFQRRDGLNLLENRSLCMCNNVYVCKVIFVIYLPKSDNSLASLLSSGVFCSLVSKFNKMYCNSITRPSNTMYDTSSFCLGYGLSDASSTGP